MDLGRAGTGTGRETPPAAPTRRLNRAAALAGALWLSLAGCSGPGSGALAPGVGAPPAASATADAEDGSAAADQQTAALSSYYADVEGGLTATGRMRRETAPADAPYSVDDLVRNFERVALYDEYVDVDGRFVRSETPAVLPRWDRPVRVGVMTGPSTSPAESARDRANVAAFTARLARLTGLDMSTSERSDVNFLVLFMNSSERTAFADQVVARYPEFAPAVVGALRDTPLDTFCTAYAFGDPGNRAVYSAVMVLIRAEHPPLTRLSCVHEEMAQAMGLPNDSPEARPSLFNDSLEFALLTEHDEILLRMLYDPRLRTGMTAAEARPLLPAIARDAMAAEKSQGAVVAAGAS
ncbi:DUF2927 domain-containing protein [Amaricoccus sp.]|uniref:DUF2927 domain-containing protein n=1 Tax=Amaricoccus sp. TaxID=1872485 RepID=UPI002B561834|nr:DUF2927 domain-containing protein [Amaricoccus sp.]HMQ92810.1 DUF2927 domain-containing protein [Amaricoccus sp.]